MPKYKIGSYHLVASEYYDPERHPTCANFRELSKKFLENELLENLSDDSEIIELGAGLSIVLEIMDENQREFKKLVLVDQSDQMLQYSKSLIDPNTKVIMEVGDARKLKFPDNHFDIAVSSLGDPYNDFEFWKEIFRVLKVGGVCLFSVPSYCWASVFRDVSDEFGALTAEFQLKNGKIVKLPSYIYSNDRQIKLIESSGLSFLRCTDLTISEISDTPISQKLLPSRGERSSVVKGYIAKKVRGKN